MSNKPGTFLWDPATNELIHDALPGVAVDFFAVVTRLGDGATLVAIAMALYWFGSPADRARRAMVLAIAVATLALVAGLKGILMIERPLYVAELPFAPEEYTGWSTPSAHSMGAAAVYGALAVVLDVGKKWQRYAVAAGLIVTVPMSRVVIGVHYLGDIIAGAALGLALVAVALRITTKSVAPMFGLSLAIALVAFGLGSEEFTAMSIGASLGGLVVWSLIEDIEADPHGASLLVLGALVVPAFLVYRVVQAVVLVDVDIQIELAGLGTVPLSGLVSTGVYAVLFGLAVAVPVIAARLNDWRLVTRLQEILPFHGRTIGSERTTRGRHER